MNKIGLCTGLLALVVVIGTGCGDKPQAGPNNVPNDSQTGIVTAPEENTPPTNASGGNDNAAGNALPKDADQEGNVSDGTVDKGSVENGNVGENQSSKETITVYYTDKQEMELKQAKQEISFKDDVQKYKAAFKALQSSGSDELIPLWGKVELKSLEYKEGQITMDIHLPDEARLGSGGEMFAIEALQNTLFQFNEVKSIELLVDGAQLESLMGHVDLEHPMLKN